MPSTTKQNWFEKLFQKVTQKPYSKKDIIGHLHEAEKNHLIDTDALTMLEGVLQVTDFQVHDVMIPRSKMSVIDEDTSWDEIIDIVTQSGHSRFPIIGDDKDQVLGILLAKDLLKVSKDQFDLKELLRPVNIIPETKRLNILLKEFREGRNHMAIIIDEYGGVSGLITIEDVIEQIVGQIEDESDPIETEEKIRKHTDEHFTIDPLISIKEFNHYFSTHFDDDEVDTLGGLLLKKFAHMPKAGETTQLDQFAFKIIKANKRRILSVQVNLSSSR